LLAAALVAAAVAGGCGGDDEVPPAPEPEVEHREPPPEPPRVREARCPAGAANCASATGTILYVERVDPDGDGDAHFVLLDSKGVTAPGITVVDVAADLRPRPLPGPGDVLSAAGPVLPGSYDQRQIEADVIHAAP
jgi:hypothetical protein